jgi:hypothetical protein
VRSTPELTEDIPMLSTQRTLLRKNLRFTTHPVRKGWYEWQREIWAYYAAVQVEEQWSLAAAHTLNLLGFDADGLRGYRSRRTIDRFCGFHGIRHRGFFESGRASENLSSRPHHQTRDQSSDHAGGAAQILRESAPVNPCRTGIVRRRSLLTEFLLKYY